MQPEVPTRVVVDNKQEEEEREEERKEERKEEREEEREEGKKVVAENEMGPGKRSRIGKPGDYNSHTKKVADFDSNDVGGVEVMHELKDMFKNVDSILAQVQELAKDVVQEEDRIKRSLSIQRVPLPRFLVDPLPCGEENNDQDESRPELMMAMLPSIAALEKMVGELEMAPTKETPLSSSTSSHEGDDDVVALKNQLARERRRLGEVLVQGEAREKQRAREEERLLGVEDEVKDLRALLSRFEHVYGKLRSKVKVQGESMVRVQELNSELETAVFHTQRQIQRLRLALETARNTSAQWEVRAREAEQTLDRMRKEQQHDQRQRAGLETSRAQLKVQLQTAHAAQESLTLQLQRAIARQVSDALSESQQEHTSSQNSSP